MQELIIKDLYNFRNRNYWLSKIENHKRKEAVNVEDYTIEHIMPQNENLSDAWKKELGENWKEIHNHYLHTIGNLTLTGYNSLYSDRSFLEKRNMVDENDRKVGFAGSPLRLNEGLGVLDQWNEIEIQKRAQELSRLATQIWSSPQLPIEILEKYHVEKDANRIYTLDDHPYLIGPMKDLFDQLRKRILNLDSSVKEEILKRYIAFKIITNFVDIIPQKKLLRIVLNMEYNNIHDPKGLCKDITGRNRGENGEVEASLSKQEQIDDIMALVKQSFEEQIESREE